MGRRRRPPGPSLLDEQQLAALLRTIDRLIDDRGDYNPRLLIAAVNALQPLGKQRALAAIEEYLRVCGRPREPARDTYLLLRVLFDVPVDPARHPFMLLGADHVLTPDEMEIAPHFPIALQDDIPFLFLRGGPGLRVGIHVPAIDFDYFRKHGTLRARPLAPTNRPLAALDALLKSPQWTIQERVARATFAYANDYATKQLLRLLETVYREEPAGDTALRAPQDDFERNRRHDVLAELAKLDVRWDNDRNCYTFADGSILPPRRRESWQPEARGLVVDVERRSDVRIDVSVHARRRHRTRWHGSTLRVLRADGDQNPVAELVLRNDETQRPVWLKPGATIVVEWSDGETSLRSPVFKP